MNERGSRRRRRFIAVVVLAASAASALGGSLRADRRPPLDALAWKPRTPRAELEAELGAAGVRPIARGSDALLLVTPVLADLFARQSALLELDGEGRLAEVSVHLVPERDDAGEALLDLYEEARRVLVARLGAPSWAHEEGRAAPGTVLAGLAEGTIVRCLQWNAKEIGFTVRFGIPRTASGQGRLELLMVLGELPEGNGNWGRDF